MEISKTILRAGIFFLLILIAVGAVIWIITTLRYNKESEEDESEEDDEGEDETEDEETADDEDDQDTDAPKTEASIVDQTQPVEDEDSEYEAPSLSDEDLEDLLSTLESESQAGAKLQVNSDEEPEADEDEVGDAEKAEETEEVETTEEAEGEKVKPAEEPEDADDLVANVSQKACAWVKEAIERGNAK